MDNGGAGPDGVTFVAYIFFFRTFYCNILTAVTTISLILTLTDCDGPSLSKHVIKTSMSMNDTPSIILKGLDEYSV